MSSVDGDEEEDEEVPKISLPDRTTRGKRMKNLLEEEDSADEEFWNQEFFAEDKADDEYKTESSSEDEADTDFSEEEEEDDDDEENEVEEKRRRKGLKAPGAPKRTVPKKPVQREKEKPAEKTRTFDPEGSVADGERSGVSSQAMRRMQDYLDRPPDAPTLRQSTRQRVEDAEKERQLIKEAKPKRKRVEQEYRAPTQEELLAEAAETEIQNLKDLATMVAQEEEVKKKSEVLKVNHTVPLIRVRSFAKPKGQAKVTWELMHGANPSFLRPRRAPPPPERALCVITGLPAKFRDPQTGAPYATLEAFKELRQRRDEGRLFWGHNSRPHARPVKRRPDF